MNEEGVRPGRYRHFKGGEYEVLFTATHSETVREKSVFKRMERSRYLSASVDKLGR